MNFWSFFWDMLNIIDWIRSWRFGLCFLLGIAAASAAQSQIGIDPWRWIVAVAILLTAVIIGIRWDGNRD